MRKDEIDQLFSHENNIKKELMRVRWMIEQLQNTCNHMWETNSNLTICTHCRKVKDGND